jgi:hypothetical protein
MKRLVTDTGGRPIKNEDLLEYIQAFEIFEKLFGDLNFGDCIIYGCELTDVGGGFYDSSDGVILYNGKLRIYEAESGIALPRLLEPDDTLANNRTFEDNVSKPTVEIAYMRWDVGGSFSLDLTTPRTRERLLGPAGTKTKIVQLGNWDMNVSVAGAASYSLNHGFADHTKIKKVKVRIYADDDSPRAGTIYDFSAPGDSSGLGSGLTGISWGSTIIFLTTPVAGGSFFDHVDFNKSPFVRGEVEITYID